MVGITVGKMSGIQPVKRPTPVIFLGFLSALR